MDSNPAFLWVIKECAGVASTQLRMGKSSSPGNSVLTHGATLRRSTLTWPQVGRRIGPNIPYFIH